MKRTIITLLILLVFVGLIWSYEGRNTELPIPKSHLSTIEFVNSFDTLDRTLVGVQPYMELTDYLSASNFQNKIELYLQEAANSGMLSEKSLVLFPEYLGTWLVLEGEKKSITEAETLEEGLSLMVASNLFEFLVRLPQTGTESDHAAAAIFRMKSRKMAKIYYNTFSELSKKFNTYIAAGSIILPGARAEEGELVIEPDHPLENVSFIFGPDGKITGLATRKAYPIASEQPFLTATSSEDIPTYSLPIGKTSLLICADSWYSEAYQKAVEGNVEIILVPSYCTGDQTMSQLWQGYSGYDEPQDVDQADIGKITERAAWEKYALPGKISKTNAQLGMNVFLRGKFWELGTDGQPFLIRDGQLLDLKPAEKAGIWAIKF